MVKSIISYHIQYYNLSKILSILPVYIVLFSPLGRYFRVPFKLSMIFLLLIKYKYFVAKMMALPYDTLQIIFFLSMSNKN
jgi:hypothetical protein